MAFANAMAPRASCRSPGRVTSPMPWASQRCAAGTESSCVAASSSRVCSQFTDSSWATFSVSDMLDKRSATRSATGSDASRKERGALGGGGEAWAAAGAALGSDAATALRLANAQLREPLTAAALHTVAAQLGADVPFFLEDGPQLGTGDGSELEPLDLLRRRVDEASRHIALDRLGVDRFNLLGHHTGANLGVQMADALGQRVNRLIHAAPRTVEHRGGFCYFSRAGRVPTRARHWIQPRDSAHLGLQVGQERLRLLDPCGQEVAARRTCIAYDQTDRGFAMQVGKNLL